MNSPILSATRLNRLRAQGYTSESAQQLSNMAFGIRFAYRTCVVIVVTAMVTQSIALFSAMLTIAFFGVILPKHPFDYVYNYTLSKMMNKPQLSTRANQLKFACTIATLWLVAVVYLMAIGLNKEATILAGLLAITASLPSTIDICVPSVIYNAVARIMPAKAKERKQIDQQKLEQKVKKMYRDVALRPEVRYHFEMGRPLAERLGYLPETLNVIPEKAIDSFAGVGYYFDLAQLKTGESVVDLGSGSGMDVFYAAKKVGEEGEVIGIDMTPEQLEKSRMLKKQFNYNQVHFVENHIEKPSVISNSIDVVISNGVINLSNQKAKVFEEIARILKPGGRLAIADIVSTTQLPESISCNISLWAACVGGAIPEEEYIAMIEAAGLKVKMLKQNPYEFLSRGAKGATRRYGVKSISLLAIKP